MHDLPGTGLDVWVDPKFRIGLKVCLIFVTRLRHINQVNSSLVRNLTKQHGVYDTLDAYYFLVLLLNSKATLLRLTSNTKMARMDKPTKWSRYRDAWVSSKEGTEPLIFCIVYSFCGCHADLRDCHRIPLRLITSFVTWECPGWIPFYLRLVRNLKYAETFKGNEETSNFIQLRSYTLLNNISNNFCV